MIVPSALPNASPSNGGGEGAPKCSPGLLESERLAVLLGPLALYAKDEKLDDPGAGLLLAFLPKELVTPNDAGGGDDAVLRLNPAVREDEEGGDPHAPIPGSTTPSVAAAERGVNPGRGVCTGAGSSYEEEEGEENDIDRENAFPRPSALSSFQAGEGRGECSSS